MGPPGSQADFAGLFFCRNGTTVAGLNYGGSGSSSAGTVGYTWNDLSGTWGWNSGLTPSPNQWSFVALVVQPNQAVIYLATTNGWQSATNTLSHPNQAFDGTGTIGTDTYSSTSRAFNGTMDEVTVFNYSLTLAQLQQLYANGSKLSSVLIGIQHTGSNFNLTWPQGTLFQATNVTGPWSRMVSGPSPLTITPTNQAGFYRVQLQ